HNHTFYLQGYTIADSVAFAEDTWGNEVYGFNANYFVAERLGTQGLRTGQGVGGAYLLNNRGCTEYSAEYETTPQNCGLRIGSFFVDARHALDARGGAWFGGRGYDIQITNGRIWQGAINKQL